MKPLASTTLRSKIFSFIIILLLVTASLFALLTVQTMNRHIINEVIRRAESLSKKSMAAVALEQPFSDTIKQTGGGTRVYEVKNGPDIFEIHTPMVFGSKQLGNVIVGINKSVLLF